MNRNAYRIARTKNFSQKNDKFIELDCIDRVEALRSFILGLSSGTYLLRTEGRAAPHLPTVVYEQLGMHAMLYVDETFLRGMAVRFPKRVQVSFTHGLDVVYLQ